MRSVRIAPDAHVDLATLMGLTALLRSASSNAPLSGVPSLCHYQNQGEADATADEAPPCAGCSGGLSRATYKDLKPLDGKTGRLLFLTMIDRVPQSMRLIDELIEKDPRPQASRVNKNESATTAKRQIGAALDDDAIAHADRTM
jgi:hypothetical protein